MSTSKSVNSGFPTVLNSLTLAGEVFAERDIAVPDADIPDLDAEALMALGLETMRTLHGARAEGGYAAPDNATTAALYPMAVAYGYGAIWDRPGLDRRQRMICSVAAFTSIHHLPQVAKFGQSALNVGLTKEQVVGDHTDGALHRLPARAQRPLGLPRRAGN